MDNNKKMRILILSRTPWRDDNSFGSSFSNIFGNIDEVEIANIYCSGGVPDTKVATRFFQISEKMILQNLFNKKNKSGQVVSVASHSDISIAENLENKEQKIFRFFQKNRFQVFMWFREIIWIFGRWKSKELNKFIDEYNPDLIFLPIYISPYMNRIGLHIKKYSSKKMVGYISDDNYTLKQFSLNPFFWLDRLVNRRLVKKAVDACQILYVISGIQKKDYDICFKKDCKVLYKGGNFDIAPSQRVSVNKPIKLLYTGNIGAGRYKTLALIGEVLDKINANEIKAIFEIYSQTPLNRSIKSSLLPHKNIVFGGSISQQEVKKKQNEADILVHVESFDLKERLLVRQSFSTKIVDYLQAARCIFAVGDKETASIDYLLNNDAAVVATDRIGIELKLLELIYSPEKILISGKKAWDCGSKNHKIIDIQSGLLQDFKNVLK